jgi:hypothetical protein
MIYPPWGIMVLAEIINIKMVSSIIKKDWYSEWEAR